MSAAEISATDQHRARSTTRSYSQSRVPGSSFLESSRPSIGRDAVPPWIRPPEAGPEILQRLSGLTFPEVERALLDMEWLQRLHNFMLLGQRMTLVAGGMLVLVSAPNLIQLIVGWELVGFEGDHGPWTYPFGYYDAQVHGETSDGE